MIDRLVFYNHYGNGDLFISREFIREIMGIIPAKEYYYSHSKNARMFADFPKLKFALITDNCIMRKHGYRFGNDIYINTWLGVDSNYVTSANSCSIDNSFRMYNDILRDLDFPLLSQPLEAYLPRIDYNFFDIAPIDRFIENNEGRKMVFITNCNVQSNQAENFDFMAIITKLCVNYSDVLFIISDSIGVVLDNLITTREITQSKDGFDLNELSYFSLFVNLLIGRSSGPQIFAMVSENCMNPNKAFLSFTYRPESAHIVNKIPPIRAKIFWSNHTGEIEVYAIICKVLDGMVLEAK